MTDAELLSGATSPITFVNGEEFQMSPLCDRDHIELDQWIRKEFMQTVYDTMPENISKEREQEIISIAQVTALGLSWMEGVGQRLALTVPGLSRILYQSIKKNHPEVKHIQLQKLLSDPRNIRLYNRKWDELNLTPEEIEAKRLKNTAAARAIVAKRDRIKKGNRHKKGTKRK